MIENKNRLWAIIAAAGIGRRMQSSIPKQYMNLAGRFIIDITIERILSYSRIHKVFVVLAEDDKFWETSEFFGDPRIERVIGGSERYLSVLNALEKIKGISRSNDWVLVHDAVRPCILKTDIEKLIIEVEKFNIGGLLGIPVNDTMKNVSPSQNVINTVEREGLWRALTPQIFQFNILHKALQSTVNQNLSFTDEASAVESLGEKPIVVEGRSDNIKITHPEDIQLAEFYILQQEKGR